MNDFDPKEQAPVYVIHGQPLITGGYAAKRGKQTPPARLAWGMGGSESEKSYTPNEADRVLSEALGD